MHVSLPWLAQHGEPTHPNELEALSRVVAEGGNLSGRWCFEEKSMRV
ncbi:hypothetical protein [Vreelandella sulfidaeris]